MDNANIREQLSLNKESLYREETFSDQQVGTIQRLTPVTADGQTDPARSTRYVGQTQVMSPAGALPIHFELEANSLEAAIDGFAEAAEKAVEETIEKIQKMQREAQSSIMMPGQDAGGSFGNAGSAGGIKF